MFKKITAACLAVLLILLTFGCGKGAADPAATRKNAVSSADKVAIVLGDRSQTPEVYAAAHELLAAHPDSVTLLKYGENFHSNPNAVKTVTAAVASDKTIKAIVFADGVKGTGAAVSAVRAARSDVCIVVCDPHESSTAIKGADLMLSVDFAALGEAMVGKAKEMGAENVVFYTVDRHLRYASVITMRKASESACKEEEMTFKAAPCVDLYGTGRTLEDAKQYMSEDVPRQKDTFGEKTALICTEPQVQGALAAQAIRYGMVMPATFMPSPLLLAADLGVDLTDHETDSAYAIEQLRAKDVGAAGHVATWSFSAYAAFLQAAFDYATGVLNGSGTETSTDNVKALVEKHTAGAKVSVSTDANGAYLVQSDLVTL